MFNTHFLNGGGIQFGQITKTKTSVPVHFSNFGDAKWLPTERGKALFEDEELTHWDQPPPPSIPPKRKVESAGSEFLLSNIDILYI